MFRKCLFSRRKWFIRTPFDCQPMEIPTTTSFSKIMNDIVPHKDINRQDELRLLLQSLPAKCDEAKENLLDAQRASKYYRKRFKRGMEAQRTHAQRAVSERTDTDLANWALHKCRQVRNPLDLSSASANMLRRSVGPLLQVKMSLEFHGSSAKAEDQKELLRAFIHNHEVAVRQNVEVSNKVNSTYAEDTCAHFSSYNLTSLPSTTGSFREATRDQLKVSEVMKRIREATITPWQSGWSQHAVVFGCTGLKYLHRQLEMEPTYSFLVIDHSLKALSNAAAALVPKFKERAHFLRSDAMFASLEVLPAACADVVVVPMPTPFYSQKSSHRRLVTNHFLCGVHENLRARRTPDDPRGIVLFTDTEPLAEFMMEQLEESKLVVPWKQKKPHQTYGRWLPLESEGDSALREFPRQRFPGIVAIAASKSADASPQAHTFVHSYNYKRKYFRTIEQGAPI